LIMRIEAVYRRGATLGRREPARHVQIGDLWIDAESHEVRRGDLEVQLTPREFKILYLLATNVGRVVSSSHLVAYAWGYEGGDPSLLKTHISHIRTKLRLPAKGPGGITVIPTVGYRLTAANDAADQREGAGDVANRPGNNVDVSPIPLRAASEDQTARFPSVARYEEQRYSPDAKSSWQGKPPVTTKAS
jgi:DNA-binding winged helix-turn-helix (wHTH) protein